MKYMLLLYSAEDAGPKAGSPEQAAEMPKWFEFGAELEKEGCMIAGDALHGIDTATTVQVRDGSTVATDGPFAETKEVLGGFYVFECDDLDQALKLAGQIPASFMGGRVEVRPNHEHV